MIVVDPQGTRDLSRDEIVSGKTILYVYPKDNTPGCTVQAVDFSQAKETLTAMGVSLYGVSLDSEKSHASFIAKHDLTIPLVVDTDKELIGTDRLPGSWGERNLYGKKVTGIIRSTYLYEDGVLVKQWNNVRAKGHGERIVQYLTEQQ